jgi:HD domain/Bacterial Ig domain
VLAVVPLLASVGFVWLVSRWFPAPHDAPLSRYVLWWLGLSVGGSVILLIADRAARRLLPLAALLQLSLVFPDAAPSRFRAALQAGKVRRLENRLETMREAREADTPREAAERLLALVAALSDHDRLTRGHSERVRAYAVMIGEELRLDRRELELLNWAALLHDVGKLEVAGDILRKRGRPTDAEWEQLRRHPLSGEQLVEPLRDWLGGWSEAVGHHHERWDGKGYPRGVAGDEIPLPGRIVAIADVFDVITSARSYKEAGSAVVGRQEIARCAGTQFDPRIVRAFLNVSLGRMRLVMGPLSWLAHTPVLARLPLASTLGSAWSAVAVVAAVTGLVATQGEPSRAVSPAAMARVDAPATTGEPRDRPGIERGDGADPFPPTPRPGRDPESATPADPPAKSPSGGGPGDPDAPGGPDDPGRDVEPPRRFDDPIRPPVDTMTVNDAPGFIAGPNQRLQEDGGARTVPAWATRISPGPASESGQTVRFEVASDREALFAAQPALQPNGTLTFTPAAEASGAATVTVTATDNGGTADGGRDRSAPQTFTIEVMPLNDAPSFVPGADQSVLEDAGAQTIEGWAAAISSGPADEAGQTVAFDTSNDNPALFSAPPEVAADGTLTYAAAPNASGTATVTVRATDDGGSADGGSDTAPARVFTIDVASVNDAPGFSAGANQAVLVDTGPRSVAGWATGISPGPGEAGPVSFNVTNDNPALFASPPQVAPDGTLTYEPASGATGVANVTVRAGDGGGTASGGQDTSAPQTFTIEVAEINDAPSFTAGAGQAVLEDAGAQSVPGWATGISPGPASESGQTVTFAVTSDNPGLFSAQPQVASNGTLSYTPAANASGTATVTVRAVDDGGTLFGGVDTSAPQTFAIDVGEVNDAPSFTGGGNQGALINIGQTIVAGWASNISPGPPSESGQSISFMVGNNNPGLFSSQPQVAPDGTLTFTPAFLALGSATVTVRATDNGGTANGGSNTSAPQSFTITIILG